MFKSQSPLCAKCGAQLAAFATEGLCSACLLERGLSPEAPAPALLSRFGDYELIEEIARGGMGVVYRARQVSLNRVVALKTILSGALAGAEERHRFRAEAETAARLQHPNIVTIHEVGEHDGNPFFSMDLVEGQSLAQLARNEPLPARRAAQYLRTIAEAVQFAHSRGVLHRDLKPSNILIDQTDQPRVTDFGLAKQLDSAATPTPRADITQTGHVLGSPNFMPPEQAAGHSRDVGPASDVYSLGAVLYQLLTGRAPFVAETVMQILRLVVEAEAVPPRLLNPSIPRDLETICLKCLAKEPHRRYANAQALADELESYLEDRPITARPAGRVEKTWRWCRRKPAFATVIFLVLVVAIGSPIAALRINRERIHAEKMSKQAEAGEKKAQSEAKKSQEVVRFLNDMLKSVGPSAALGRDTTMLREILDNTSGRLGEELKDQPAVEAELRMVIGGVYEQLTSISNAEVMLRRALALRTQLLGSEHPDVATVGNALGDVLRQGNKLIEAEQLLRDTLALRKKLFGDEHSDTAISMNNLGAVLWQAGKLDASETMLLQALAIQRKLGKKDQDFVDSLNNLGLVLRAQRKFEAAEAVFREALELGKQLLGNNHPLVALIGNNFGLLLWDENKLEEAELRFREAFTTRLKVLGNEHSWTMGALNNLVGVLVAAQKSEEADKLFDSLLTPALRGQPESADLLRARASFRAQAGRFEEAGVDLSEAIKLVPDIPWDWLQLATLLRASNDLPGYRKHCRAMLDRFQAAQDPTTAERTGKACLLIRNEEIDLVRIGRLIDLALDLGKEHKDLPWFQVTKCWSEYRQGHFSNAADWAAKALVHRGADHYRDAEVLALLAMALHQIKQTDKARAALAESAEIARTKLPEFGSRRLKSRYAESLIVQSLREEAATLIEMPSDNDPFKVKE